MSVTSTDETPRIFAMSFSSGSVEPIFSSITNTIFTAERPNAIGSIVTFVSPSPANRWIEASVCCSIFFKFSFGDSGIICNVTITRAILIWPAESTLWTGVLCNNLPAVFASDYLMLRALRAWKAHASCNIRYFFVA